MHYPIYFDETEIFTPDKWDEDYEVIENTNQTEAGTDQVTIIRYDKLTVSVSFSCSSNWAAKFAAFRDKDEIAVRLYDIKGQDYKIRQMRIRDFKVSTAYPSKKTRNTNGLSSDVLYFLAQKSSFCMQFFHFSTGGKRGRVVER